MTSAALTARTTAMVVYHYSEYHTRPGSSGFEQPMVDGLPVMRRLLDRCRSAGVTIAYVISETPRDLAIGEGISEAIAPLPGETIIRQVPNPGSSGGAFATPEFVDLLREHACDTLLITGIAIDRGLNDTARRARGYGCRPIMVREACYAQDIADSPVGPVSREDVERVHLAALYRSGIEVLTVEEVIAALH